MHSDCVLIVEDAVFFSRLLEHKLQKELGFETVSVATRAATQEALEQQTFSLALVDLGLPDAPEGEVVKDIIDAGVPVVIFSANFDEKIRERALAMGVIDYVVKETPSSIEYVTSLASRIHKNRRLQALIIDDSPTVRNYLVNQLRIQQFQVLTASDGEEALRLLSESPEVKLILVDYNMPGIDGYQLVSAIRRKYHKRHISIIGISGDEASSISARFIKSGANDFIRKPFSSEELLCRISQNLNLLEKIESFEWLSTHDPLTRLSNQRRFFNLAQGITQEHPDGTPSALAMIAIDQLEQLIDRFGNDAGDDILCRIAELIDAHFAPPDVVGSFDRQGFCVLLHNHTPRECAERLEALRNNIDRERIPVADTHVSVTLRIGVHFGVSTSLNEMIAHPDILFYGPNDPR